jgi:hypothetical protein
MNNKFFKIVLGLAIAITSLKASAQTTYESGLYMTSTRVNNNPINMWNYFNQDYMLTRYFSGRSTFKTLTNAHWTLVAILLDVPTAEIKKVAILNPQELKELFSEMPRLTYAPTNETKMISGFNCRRIIATNVVTKRTYDVWTTKDVIMPEAATPVYYQGIDGFPIQYVAFRDGVENMVTVLTIRNVTIPPDTFTVPGDFQRITYNDYKMLSGRY